MREAIIGAADVSSNLDIDDKLLEDARIVGGHRTKEAAVTEALQEYIQRRKQLEILSIAGTVDYYDDYQAKKKRRKR